MLVHMLADYGHGDLAFAEVVQRMKLPLLDAAFRTVPLGLGSIGLGSGVCRARSLSPHICSRSACTKCGALPAPSPHNIRSAKLSGNEGVASGSSFRINRA